MMSSLTDRLVYAASEALLNRDNELCDPSRCRRRGDGTLEKQVDQGGVRLLVRFSPDASDMREVVSTMKISANLESIADHSLTIARRAKTLNDLQAPTYVLSAIRMSASLKR